MHDYTSNLVGLGLILGAAVGYALGLVLGSAIGTNQEGGRPS